MLELPSILVHRLPRLGGDWNTARSWFGGLPCLGDTPWPRAGDDGPPLVFVAQLDLAELRETAGTSPLPSSGALAFFIGTDPRALCAVRHVAAGAPETPLPHDALPADHILGGLPPTQQLDDAPQTFPRWPVGLRRLDLPRDLDPEQDPSRVHTAQADAVAAHLPHRPYFLSARAVFEEAIGEPAPIWWACAQRFARQLLEAQLAPGRSGGRGFLARWFGRSDGFDELVLDVQRWVADRDPWAPMDPACAERLDATVRRVRTEFRGRARRAPFVKDLQDAVLREMLVADDAVYARLPIEVRRHVDERDLSASDGWHQIFGFGLDIQQHAVWEHAQDVLLLQLAYDDLMEWVFGDLGVYIFWLSPEHAAVGDFSQVQATFECH